MAFKNNYTLGRGKLHFAKLDASGVLGGEMYFGNTTDFSHSVNTETLDHYSSDYGLNEKDLTLITQINRSASFTTDNINPKTLAFYFFGSVDALTVASSTVTGESLGKVEVGMFYQLGMTSANPSGARKVTSVTVSKSGTALTAGTDYVVDTDLGRVEILEGGTVADGDALTASYTISASTRTRVISGSEQIEGALRFIAYNPEGDDIDYYFPSVKLTPDGDYALKGNDLQAITFSVEIQTPSDGRAAVYADGRAVTA